MRTFDHILVPVPLTGPGISQLPSTILSILDSGSHIHILGIIELPLASCIFSAPHGPNLFYHAGTEECNAMRLRLEQMVKTIAAERAADFSIFVVQANYQDAIILYQQLHPVSVIAVPAPPARGLLGRLLGNITQRLSVLSDCPVLTIQPGRNYGPVRKVVMPLCAFYPLRKLQLARRLGRFSGAEVHMVCSKSELASDQNKSFEFLLVATGMLKQFGIRYKVHLATARNITDALLSYAAEAAADLILVNPGHESRLTGGGLLYPAPQIVDHSAIPVLTVKRAAAVS